MNKDILQQLDVIIQQRIVAVDSNSYVSSLMAKGRSSIAQKVGEEAVETVIASLDNNGSLDSKQAVVAEMADLWFHCLVLLAEQKLSSDDVFRELERRFGRSGLDEKASRVNN